MNCPQCSSFQVHICDSRHEGTHVRRRRECMACGFRYSTMELPVEEYNRLKYKTIEIPLAEYRKIMKAARCIAELQLEEK